MRLAFGVACGRLDAARWCEKAVRRGSVAVAGAGRVLATVKVIFPGVGVGRAYARIGVRDKLAVFQAVAALDELHVILGDELAVAVAALAAVVVFAAVD